MGDKDFEPLRQDEGVTAIRLQPDGFTIQQIRLSVAAKQEGESKRSLKTIEGVLIDFFETGCEDVIWMVQHNRRLGYL